MRRWPAKERGERDELEKTKKAVGEAKKKMTILEKRLEASMKRGVPIVAAIVLKAVYKHAVGIPQQGESPENQDTRGEGSVFPTVRGDSQETRTARDGYLQSVWGGLNVGKPSLDRTAGRIR